MELFKLTCGDGAFLEVAEYGATMHRIVVPDRDGNLGDVVLHADPFDPAYRFRANVIGRCANRIAHGRYTLGGETVQLDVGFDGNMLHSGSGNYANREWKGERLSENAVRFTLREEGEGGWPGGADAAVTYTFSKNDGAYAVNLHYEITPDRDSVVNPTNHAYFNLKGEGDVLGHELWLNVSRWTPKGDVGMPEGGYADVEGTPFDFRTPRTLGAAYEASKPEDFRFAAAFDDNLVIDGEGLRIAARLKDPETGRVMETYTDLPGMQLYTPARAMGWIPPFAAVCFETQFFPNAVNCPDYPSPVVKGGETLTTDTIYRFTTE